MLDSRRKRRTKRADLRAGWKRPIPRRCCLSLVQLTGERHWLGSGRPFIRGPMNYQEFMPEQLRASIRDRLAEVLAEHARSGTRTSAAR